MVAELTGQSAWPRTYPTSEGMPWSAAILYGLSPPVLLEMTLFNPAQLEDYLLEKDLRYGWSMGPTPPLGLSDAAKMAISGCLGIVVYAALAWALLFYAYVMLRITCGRIDDAPRRSRHAAVAKRP